MGVERNRHAATGDHGPPFLAGALDEHLVRLELVPGGAEPAPVELLEVAPLQRSPDRGELLAETRSEQGQIRLHTQLCVDLDRNERPSPATRRAGRRPTLPPLGGALDHEVPQRLLHLEPCRLPRLVTERRPPPRSSTNVGEQVGVGRRQLPASRRGGRTTVRRHTAPPSVSHKSSERNGITGAIHTKHP